MANNPATTAEQYQGERAEIARRIARMDDERLMQCVAWSHNAPHTLETQMLRAERDQRAQVAA